jgi:hypothetical protein
MVVGDKVIALSDAPNEQSQQRKKGETYEVSDSIYCIFCANHLININNTESSQFHVKCRCGAPLYTAGLMFTPSTEFELL